VSNLDPAARTPVKFNHQLYLLVTYD